MTSASSQSTTSSYSQGFKNHKLNLKTLVNLVEALFFKIVELWCLCCMMMFRWTKAINGQDYKSFEIYVVTIKIRIDDWISPLNKRSGFWFILTQQSMGGNEHGTCKLQSSIFTSLKHLMMLLKCTFSGLHFYTLSKTVDTDSSVVQIS